MKKQAGFSLIEIMIAVVIMGLMAATIGPKIVGYLFKARTSQAKTTLVALKSAVIEYATEIGHVPTKKEGGLNALVQKPGGPAGEKWKEPFLSEVPTDPWGFEFEYNCPPQVHKKYKKFEIFSRGEKNDEEDPALAVGE